MQFSSALWMTQVKEDRLVLGVHILSRVADDRVRTRVIVRPVGEAGGTDLAPARQAAKELLGSSMLHLPVPQRPHVPSETALLPYRPG